MLKLDWNLLWTVVNLIILFLLLKKFLFGPVCKIIDERQSIINNDLESAKKAKNDAEKMKSDYEAEIAGAHTEALEITKRAREIAEKEGDLIIQNAREESAKILKDAEKSAENEKSRALDDAKGEIADLALLAAAKVINKNVDSDSDKDAVNDFLSEVGAHE